MKTCLVCRASHPKTAFAPNKTGRGGLHPWCRECVSRYNKARYAGKAVRCETRPSNAHLPQAELLAKDLTERKAAIPGYRIAEQRFLVLRKKGNAPPWSKLEDTLPMYLMAAQAGDFAVDHIVPIHNKAVCGLHVPWNLQLLTPSQNSRKGSRLDVLIQHGLA